MQRSQYPFNGLEQGPDFDRARSMIATPFQYADVKLDAAAANQILNVSGDFLYVDAASTGIVTLELNNQYNDASAPFKVSAGFGLAALFKQLKLSWTAQPGKIIRLMYSTGDRVVPTNSTTISGSVSINDTGFTYGASYQSATALLAATPDPIFLPAANPNGAIVWSASFACRSVAGSFSAILAKNAAPANTVDGDLIVGVDTFFEIAGNLTTCASLKNAVRIPAGKGLYYITQANETASQRSVLYTLL